MPHADDERDAAGTERDPEARMPGEEVEEIAEEVAVHNPDEVTRREALEQELMARDRSDEGTDVGDEID
jgi:hypothetical protein